MDLNDVVSLAKVVGLNAINEIAGDVTSASPKHTVKFETNKIIYTIAGELAPVIFYDGPFERRLLGVCQPGIFINLHLQKIAHALAAYSVGRVTYFDGKQYPAKIPFLLPFPDRSNVINYIAVYRDGNSGCVQLRDMLFSFFSNYLCAWRNKNVLDKVANGTDSHVSGAPIEFIKHLVTERNIRKYGGVWTIPGFGPAAAAFVRETITCPDDFVAALAS